MANSKPKAKGHAWTGNNSAESMTRKFTFVAGNLFELDTTYEIELAKQEMRALGISEVPVWFGDPDCVDSYQSPNKKLFA